MSPWTADPVRTHAMLVGVEKYEAGADWNKLSILRDVREFHDWLRSKGVPAEQIVTLFSPRDESIAALAQSRLDATPATSENVRRVFDSLKAKSGDLLFLFWGGHGALHEKQRRLFLADATPHNKRNINFDELRESLASTYFKGFQRQILIVDACATYEKFSFTFPSEPIPCGTPLPNEQFIFFAARPGQAARDLGEEKRGLLSRELLTQIRKLDEPGWPPDMLKLARSVQEEFTALRQSGNFRDLAQTPMYQFSQDWDGSVIELRGRKQAPSGPPPGESWKLTPKQLIPLTDALITVSRMQTPAGRDLLLAQMRSEISGAIPRGDDAMSDVMNMLRTAANYPGGLEELFWLVYLFEGQSMAWRGVAKVVAERLPNLRLPSAESEPVIEGGTGKLDLVAALDKCPTLAEKSGRNLCVALLDERISGKITRQDDRKADLLSIVSTCLSYEGGIDSLVEVVEAREKGSVYMPQVRGCADALLKTV